MSRLLPAMAAIAVVAISLATTGGTAAAHERRMVGPYQLVVGFLSEPAFVGETNAASISVTDTRSNNKPVDGLERTVRVDVFSGGLAAPLSLPLATRFGQPGTYAAYFVPTKSGGYRFVFKGKIESTDLDETFESGPGRFNDVESTTALQYPDKMPVGADLSRRLVDLQSAADQGRLLALGAIALGAAALALALVRRRA